MFLCGVLLICYSAKSVEITGFFMLILTMGLKGCNNSEK